MQTPVAISKTVARVTQTRAQTETGSVERDQTTSPLGFDAGISDFSFQSCMSTHGIGQSDSSSGLNRQNVYLQAPQPSSLEFESTFSRALPGDPTEDIATAVADETMFGGSFRFYSTFQNTFSNDHYDGIAYDCISSNNLCADHNTLNEMHNLSSSASPKARYSDCSHTGFHGKYDGLVQDSTIFHEQEIFAAGVFQTRGRMSDLGLNPLKWLREHFIGWRRGVLASTIIVGTTFLINLTLFTLAASRSGTSHGVLFSGSCSVMKSTNICLHLIVNALATLVFGASTYTMQCLSSPTRSEVDAAHQLNKKLDIGITSIRNLFRIHRTRALTWAILCVSSLPIHLLWNSVVYPVIGANEFAYLVVDANFLSGAPFAALVPGQQDLTASQVESIRRSHLAGNFTRHNVSECMLLYEDPFVSRRKNLLAVTSPTQGYTRMSPGTAFTESPIVEDHRSYSQPLWNGSSLIAFEVIGKNVGGMHSTKQKSWVCGGYDDYYNTYNYHFSPHDQDMFLKTDVHDGAVTWNDAANRPGIYYEYIYYDGYSYRIISNISLHNDTSDSIYYNAHFDSYRSTTSNLGSGLICDRQAAVKYFHSHHGQWWLRPSDPRCSVPDLGMPGCTTASLDDQQCTPCHKKEAKYLIDYCLSEDDVEQSCRIQYVPTYLGVVVLCNLIKLGCMLVTLQRVWHQHDPILATVGDAVASFLERPDKSTQYMCLAGLGGSESRVSCGNPKGGQPSPLLYNARESKILLFSVPGIRGYLALVPTLFYLLAAAMVLDNIEVDMAASYASKRSSLSIGLGSATPYTLWREFKNVTSGVLITNTFQILISFLSVFYNSLLTTHFATLEWAAYFRDFRPLRVTMPRGDQKTSWFLQLPFKYSLGLSLCFATIHWLTSESVFLEVVQWSDIEGNSSPDLFISGVGFSPVGILCAVCFGVVLLLALILHSLRTFDARIPPHMHSSLIISAACHPREDERQSPEMMSTKQLRWGVVNGGEYDRVHGAWVGHCSFSSLHVETPVNGNWYA